MYKLGFIAPIFASLRGAKRRGNLLVQTVIMLLLIDWFSQSEKAKTKTCFVGCISLLILL
jgi:hypothetical protein